MELSSKPVNGRMSNLGKNLKYVVILLIAIIVGMLILWQPWVSTNNENRTVTVTGETKITAEPDEYVFYPSYEFKNPNKDTALNELNVKSEEITAGLKGLEVPDNKIKTNTNGNDYRYFINPETNETTYTLQFTVTVMSRDDAQKVQDYLVATSPTGAVSPQASFSEEKSKELESKARDEATKDARAKADQSANNLGFKIGDVKSVEDGSGFDGGFPMPAQARTMEMSADMMVRPGLAVQPGENELSYSVKITYYLQ